MVLLLGFALQRSLWLLLVAVLAVVVLVASAYTFLAHRGAIRMLAAVLLAATPLVLVGLLVSNGLLWGLLGSSSPRGWRSWSGGPHSGCPATTPRCRGTTRRHRSVRS